ncbi:MAG: Fic family protein [Methanomassiliicoccaceae archaeon]|nr:Fic family protein [Methanomassiliicoccaceae archaeon]
MRRITVDRLMVVHRSAIVSGMMDELKLKDAVRDIGTLEYIVEKANSIRDDLSRAAFLLYSIANYHPFVEGNKRTAFLMAGVVSKKCDLKEEAHESNIMIRKIAAGEMDEEGVKRWIEEKFFKTTH